MTRLLTVITLIAALFLIGGCGGSDSNSRLITIRSTQFDPSTRTITRGQTITWVNGDSATHSVVSGTLEPTDFPRLIDVGILATGFMDTELSVLFGDAIRFTNLSSIPLQVEAKNSNFDVVFISPELGPNESAVWDIPSAGVFTIRQNLQPAIPLTVTAVGIPMADGLFDSGVIVPSGEFQFTPTRLGTQQFFCGVHFIEQGSYTVEP